MSDQAPARLFVGIDIGGTSVKAAAIRVGEAIRQSQVTLAPSSGTPGEGRGGGSAQPEFFQLGNVGCANPLPNPPPEYREREPDPNAMPPGENLWTGRSRRYERPTLDGVVAAIRQAVVEPLGDVVALGLCLPGLFDRDRGAVTLSVNVPGIVGIPVSDLISAALGRAVPERVFTDAHATAHDLYTSRNLTGRLFMLALGTGVGAAVLDDGATPLRVDGDSPGHFGQIDVSIEGHPVVGPDGGAGSLEGYIGVAALRDRYGPSFIDRLATGGPDDPPLQALARAIRIAHGLYRPDHVVLAGGIGVRLGPALPALRQLIGDRLTRIARPGWTLATGDSDFHAALGAAKLAGEATLPFRPG